MMYGKSKEICEKREGNVEFACNVTALILAVTALSPQRLHSQSRIWLKCKQNLTRSICICAEFAGFTLKR